MKYLILILSLLFSSTSFAQTFEQQLVTLINAERVNANLREAQIYGSVRIVRQPLVINPVLTQSAQWWCDGLRGTGLFGHVLAVSPSGYLILPTGKLGRTWFPQRNQPGETGWYDRIAYLGESNFISSENGLTLKNKDMNPVQVFSAWRNSGYSYDPTQAKSHYSNVVSPYHTDIGVGVQGWMSGSSSCFADFLSHFVNN